MPPEAGNVDSKLVRPTAAARCGRKVCSQVQSLSPDYLRQLVERSEDVIVIHDLNGRFLYYNGARGFDITPREVVGRSPYDFFHEDQAAPIVSDIAAVARSGARMTGERRVTWRGRDYWFLEHAFPLEDESGEITAVAKVLRDISDLKRSEHQVRASEERYRTLFSNAPIGIYRTTPDGRIVIANPALVRMLGYSSYPELTSRNLEEEGFEPEYPRSDFKERIERAGRIVGMEAAWRRRDGSTIYVREHAQVVRDAAGRIQYYEGTVEDITERKRAERDASRSHAFQQTVLHSLSAHVAILNDRGAIVQVNDAWKRFARDNHLATPNYGLGVDYLTLCRNARGPSSEGAADAGRGIEAVLAGDEKSCFFEYPCHSPAERRWFQMRVTGFRTENRNWAIVAHENVTEIKSTAEALRKSEQRLRMLIESAEDLIVLHDVDGRYLYYNGPSRYHVKPQDVIGRTAHDMFPPEQADTLVQQLRKVAETGQPLTVENAVTWEGETLWFSDDIFPVYDQTGTLTSIAKICRNITRRKLTEDALRQREAILSAVSYAAQLFLAAAGWEENMRAAWEQLGTAADVGRVYIYQNVPTGDGPTRVRLRSAWINPQLGPTGANLPASTTYEDTRLSRWMKTLARGEEVVGNVTDLAQDEQHDLPARGAQSVLIVPIFVGGAWWGFIGFEECRHQRCWTTSEIEALRVAASTLSAAIHCRNADAALRHSEHLFRALAENIPGVVYLARDDQRQTIEYINDAIRDLTGLPPASFVSGELTLLELCHPDDRSRVDELSQTALQTGNPIVGRARLRHTSENYHWVEIHQRAVPASTDSGIRLEGALFDISEQKRTEEEREQLLTQLRETLDHVQTLRGMLPICAGCKRIRDDHGYWQQVEEYVHEHAGVEFSHCLCPDCVHKLYPDIADEVERRVREEEEDRDQRSGET